MTEQERKDELKRLDEEEKAGAVAWANNMYSYHTEGKGWGHYTNPNGKWDGYSVGGRYSGYFRLKDGAKGNIGERSWLCSEDYLQQMIEANAVDQAVNEDIDWNKMREECRKEATEEWNQRTRMLNKFKSMAKKRGEEYTKEMEDRFLEIADIKGKTKEEFMEEKSVPMFYAVLRDGKWEENLSREYCDNLIKSLPKDEILTFVILTFVDCHS